MTHSFDILSVIQKTIPCGIDSSYLEEIFRKTDLDSPLLLLSRSAVGRNYQALKSALPRVNIHYAIKPNNHETIIEEVYRSGGNFDVCSAGEIDLVLKTGINPASLIHSHPIKSIREFDLAVGKGIRTFVVDNFDEVKKLSRYTNEKLKILIRFRINSNTQAVVNLQYKFGCTTDEVLDLARQIKQRGHEYHGLCFHIGSQCTTPHNYVEAITTAHNLIQQLDQSGFDTQMLDIGGGFPVEYIEAIPPIEEFCKPINEALTKHIRPGVKVVSEPGRFIAATPVILVCTVIGKSIRDGKYWYYLDDGLYSTFSGILYDSCQYPVITNKVGDQKLSVLSGPTCDSFDVMYDGLMIPEHEVGDRMIFTSTGAYCSVSGSNFNALKRPQYQVID